MATPTLRKDASASKIYEFLINVSGTKNLNRELKKVKSAFGSLAGLKKATSHLSTIEKLSGKINERLNVGKGVNDKTTRKLMQQLDVEKGMYKLFLSEVDSKKKLSSQIEKQRKLSKEFNKNLTLGLSLMFFSMNINRGISTLLSSIFKDYQQITKGQNEYSNAINRSSASLSFLKFVLVDTFGKSEIVQKMTSAFSSLVDVIADAFSKHPTLSVSILTGGIVLKTLGSITEFVAQIWLLYIALKNAGKLGKLSTTLNTIFKTSGKGVGVLLPLLGKLVAGATLVYEASMLIKAIFSDEELPTKLRKIVSSALALTGTGLLLYGQPIGWVVLGVKLAFDLGVLDDIIKLGLPFVSDFEKMYNIITKNNAKLTTITNNNVTGSANDILTYVNQLGQELQTMAEKEYELKVKLKVDDSELNKYESLIADEKLATPYSG